MPVVFLWVLLGKKHNKIFHPIYYASKALNGAQKNYTITEHALFDVVYDFKKFGVYLLGTKVIVHTYHVIDKVVSKVSKPRNKINSGD